MGLMLSLAGSEHREAARERVVREWERCPQPSRFHWPRHRYPVSALLWTLRHDDPALNSGVYRNGTLRGVIRDEIRRGLRFGPVPPGADPREPLHVADSVRLATDIRPDEFRFDDPAELVAALRAGTGMKRADAAARRVGRDDWGAVVRADREQPLPGHARWALAIRPDCPSWARSGFDTHPAFAHRLRQAGIFDGPRHYLETGRPAIQVLNVLANGDRSFPGLTEAVPPLRAWVREVLGGDGDAWAQLAWLLPGFTGTAPELFDSVRG
ncbi:hypothetical protein [Streptomyces sp. NPDC051561]|uniref:hypothetical protein n=1 Tax=Streptomyces sp. NPDC051561 TaxID=3365658 RepID=UPI0037BCBB82